MPQRQSKPGLRPVADLKTILRTPQLATDAAHTGIEVRRTLWRAGEKPGRVGSAKRAGNFSPFLGPEDFSRQGLITAGILVNT